MAKKTLTLETATAKYESAQKAFQSLREKGATPTQLKKAERLVKNAYQNVRYHTKKNTKAEKTPNLTTINVKELSTIQGIPGTLFFESKGNIRFVTKSGRTIIVE